MVEKVIDDDWGFLKVGAKVEIIAFPDQISPLCTAFGPMLESIGLGCFQLHTLPADSGIGIETLSLLIRIIAYFHLFQLFF